MPSSITELAAHLEVGKRFQLAQQVRDYLRPVRFEGSEFEFGAARELPHDFVRELGAALRETTGVNWRLKCVEDAGAPTLREEQAANESAERDGGAQLARGGGRDASLSRCRADRLEQCTE
jgi:DNA polymerase-3 subunit gamma/tau